MSATATPKRLLVLGAGPAQLGLLEAARAEGVWSAVCDRDPGAPGFGYADRRCIVSTEDEPALERLAAALALDGIIATGRDRSAAVAARIAAKLGIPHPVSPATAALCSNRLRQREALASAGVPQPRWEVPASGEDTVSLAPPLVVKVIARNGQAELTLVESSTELAAALAAARGATRGGPVLVEEYLDGPEVSVTGFSVGSVYTPLMVSDRVCSDPPAFGVPLSETWPSPHAQQAAEIARRAVEALSLANGPSHVRLRLSGGGPEVLQVSARLGANHEAELVELATGIDLHRLALASALGWPLELSRPSPAPALGAATVRFLVAPPGVLESVEVPQGLPGVLRTWIYRRNGYRFGPLRRPSDRAGAVLVAGATRAEAVARAQSALERIRLFAADAEALV